MGSVLLSEIIRSQAESILEEWERFAETLGPAGRGLTREERRDAAVEILEKIVAAMESSAGSEELVRQAEGKRSPPRETREVAKQHASDRFLRHFALEQMTAEYRALRANVTRRWTEHLQNVGSAADVEQLTRFNAALDSSMSVAIRWYDRRLEEARHELWESDRAKDEFLAILGHELRNPLAPLSTALQLLKQAEKKPELLRNLRLMMDRQLSHLLRLVDDLLDVSRIRRGEIQLRSSPVDLRVVIEVALEQTEALIAERQHELVEQHSDEHLSVIGDLDRLTQVVANLLSNAAKYTSPGGTITLRSEVDDGFVVVRVRDTGFGVPPEQAESIFELFRQVPDHRSRTGGGGLGVGLALSKRLVEMHGGTIRVESEGLHRGSEFIVRLPVSRSERVEAALEGQEAPVPSRNVLVVDDNVDAADSLCMLLEQMGHDAEAVYDGPTALGRIGQVGPEIVFLDVGMPGMNGVEVARHIRAMPKGDHVLVVALTGWSPSKLGSAARSADFDGYLVKPVALAELRRVLLRSTDRT